MLKKWREVEPFIQRVCDEEVAARKLAYDLLSELEEKVASQREKDRLQDDLERGPAGQKEAKQLVIDNRRRQHRDINLFMRVKYMQNYMTTTG